MSEGREPVRIVVVDDYLVVREGLRMMLVRSREELLANIQMASDRVDDPSTLAKLKNACEGKLRDSERRGTTDP